MTFPGGSYIFVGCVVSTGRKRAQIHRFWDTIIEPVLEALGPEVVVEIGSDQGANTRNLLCFCERRGVRLHAVDPQPRYDAAELEERHNGHLVFHQKLSLEALKEIEPPDAVLIDGDHNWYTVINELRALERLCAPADKPYPLVMLHDIGWPYGRRDLYYDPGTIPKEHRSPYAKKGILLESSELSERGGINRELYNAEHSGGPENGVLTAIEDFLQETEQPLDLKAVRGLHGLAMLVPRERRSRELDAILSSVEQSPATDRHMERLEEERLQRLSLDVERAASVRSLRARVENLNSSLREQEDRAQEASAQRARLQAERDRRAEEVGQLTRWLQQLDEGVSALFESRQWKVGRSLGELYRRASAGRPVTTAADSIESIIQRFRQWDRSRASGEAGGSDDGSKKSSHTSRGASGGAPPEEVPAPPGR